VATVDFGYSDAAKTKKQHMVKDDERSPFSCRGKIAQNQTL